MTSTLYLHSFSTPVGTIRTAATDSALVMIDLPGHSEKQFRQAAQKLFPDHGLSSEGKINTRAQAELLEYLAGTRRTFTVKTALFVGPFQKRVLDQVVQIPYGQTTTYGTIARTIGQPGAARAVGTANGRNPLPLIIPCHRVVATNGLGGYGGGLPLKQKLLLLERGQ